MNFKEQLKDDLDIFLNIDEFGETFFLDGIEYTGVIEQPVDETPKEEYEGIIREIDYIVYLKYNKSLNQYTNEKKVKLNEKILMVHRAYRDEDLFVLELVERVKY